MESKNMMDLTRTYFMLKPLSGVVYKTYQWPYLDLVSSYGSGYKYRHKLHTFKTLGKLKAFLCRNDEYLMVHGWPNGKKQEIIRRLGSERPEENLGDTWIADQRGLSYFSIDCDGFKGDIQEFIKVLPGAFHGKECVVQFSASYMIKRGLRAHLFFELDKPLLLRDMKKIAQIWNKQVDNNVFDLAIYSAPQVLYCAAPHFLKEDGNSTPDFMINRVVIHNEGGGMVNTALLQNVLYENSFMPTRQILFVSGDRIESVDQAHADIGVQGHHLPGLKYCRMLAREGRSHEVIERALKSAFATCNRMGKSESVFEKTYLSEKYIHDQVISAEQYVTRSQK